jgi:hypothetical protein
MRTRKRPRSEHEFHPGRMLLKPHGLASPIQRRTSGRLLSTTTLPLARARRRAAAAFSRSVKPSAAETSASPRRASASLSPGRRVIEGKHSN